MTWLDNLIGRNQRWLKQVELAEAKLDKANFGTKEFTVVKHGDLSKYIMSYSELKSKDPKVWTLDKNIEPKPQTLTKSDVASAFHFLKPRLNDLREVKTTVNATYKEALAQAKLMAKSNKGEKEARTEAIKALQEKFTLAKDNIHVATTRVREQAEAYCKAVNSSSKGTKEEKK